MHMARGFEDLSFEWAGKTYPLPANRVLGAIARIEDVITLNELQRHGQKGSTPLAKLAMAYGVLLRYAGAEVSDTDIYEAMFGTGSNVETQSIVEAIVTLISMMIPPSAQSAMAPKKKDEPAKGNSPAAAITNVSKKRTNSRPQSAK